MKKLKVIFTDSGLGGFTIMADFAKLAKSQGLNVDLIYFNAQYNRSLGYKKMDSKKQIHIFNSALQSMQDRYNPDIIAIACNTLSVVYLKSDFYKKSNTTILDIIETGKSLVKHSDSSTVIEIAMPTTIDSKVYSDKSKRNIGIASDTSLPDAIENGETSKVKAILNEIFENAKLELINKKQMENEIDLFLGCTHFPIIKDKFLEAAKKEGIKIDTLLDPNAKFSQLILEKTISMLGASLENTTYSKPKNTIKVISRMEFKESEVKNISYIVEKQSYDAAEALRNYEYNPDLF